MCKACRSRITTIAQRTSVAGQHRHVFCNPHGYVYSLGCFSEAFGCMALGPPSQEFSWFAGWAWRIAVCKGCRNHLGWEFESTQDPACFWGLILDQLVDEREGKI
ncbi:MAG: hypothetical protein PWQ57_958 [Desulfovibrionales bacterium]|nr:hypothetical protein [Desulfovibrionales bacterium]